MNERKNESNNVTILGKYAGRYSQDLVGIADVDRMRSVYVLGRTGSGKSTLLLNMAISDIQRGHGVCVIDPHSDLATMLISYIPASRIKDVVYFNAADTHFPIAYNPLHTESKAGKYLVTSGIISTLKKIWGDDAWGNRMEHILRFTLLALLEYPSATLLDVTRMLTDEVFRSVVVQHVHSPVVKAFWRNEFGKFTPSLRQEAINPILNKMGLFAANTILRNIVGQERSSFDFYELMASRKILICNIPKGVLGEDACSLLGSILVSGIQLAALRRAETDDLFRVPFFLYVDEAHSFISQAYIDYLAELRKYGLSIFLTHQYLDQLNPKISAAIFGNVGTIISFALGSSDATVFAKEFASAILPRQFIDLPRYHMYLRLMVDGVIIKPFSAVALPITAPRPHLEESIIKHTRKYYCTPLEKVELELLEKELRIQNASFKQASLFG